MDNDPNSGNNMKLPDWVVDVKDNQALMPINIANSLFGNKTNLYRQVRVLGWLQTAFESKAVTTNYLLGILNNTYFRIKTTDVNNLPQEIVSWTKLDLLVYLEQNYLKKPSGLS